MKHRTKRVGSRSAAICFQFATSAIVASILLWSPVVRAADLNTEMQNFFNDIGAIGTASGPSAYQGQSMNLYTGGQMHMRTPLRSYQLYSLSLPSIKGGCGGIDAYLGSFSYINGNQWKSLIKNLGGPIVGLLIQSALKSINPLIASTIEDLQKVIQWANQANVNSCEAAKQLLNGVSNALEVDTYSSCIAAGEAWGMDQAEVRDKCRVNAKGMNEDARTKGPRYSNLPPRNINVLWHALKNTSFTADEKETFINLLGTYVLRGVVEGGEDQPVTPDPYPSTIDSIFALVYGTDAPSSAGKEDLNWWTCLDADCLTLRMVKKSVTSFRERVKGVLVSIRTKLRSYGPPLSEEEISFINNTTVPVWRMLNIGYIDTSETLNDMIIHQYGEAIAVDYAAEFITRGLKEAKFYLAKGDWRATEERWVERATQDVRDALSKLDGERLAVRSRVGNMSELISKYEQIERSLYAGMPVRMRANMDWTAAMKTQWRF